VPEPVQDPVPVLRWRFLSEYLRLPVSVLASVSASVSE
jgi:hypothetical protein